MKDPTDVTTGEVFAVTITFCMMVLVLAYLLGVFD